MKKIIGEIRKTKIKNVKKIKDFEKFLLREKKNVYIYIYISSWNSAKLVGFRRKLTKKK